MEVESFPNGIKLIRNSLGGLSVEVNGNYIGWIHASVGNQWSAHVRGTKPGDPGTILGRFTKAEAVQRIAHAAGWRLSPNEPTATEETWPGETHFRAMLAVQRKFPGWTVSHYPHGTTRSGINIPAGHYCASYWHLSEPPIVAPDLDLLTAAIQARNDTMNPERRWADQSGLSSPQPDQNASGTSTE